MIIVSANDDGVGAIVVQKADDIVAGEIFLVESDFCQLHRFPDQCLCIRIGKVNDWN
jgi:hypothetical protein